MNRRQFLIWEVPSVGAGAMADRPFEYQQGRSGASQFIWKQFAALIKKTYFKVGQSLLLSVLCILRLDLMACHQPSSSYMRLSASGGR